MKRTMFKSAIAAASATVLSSGALAFDSLSEIPGNLVEAGAAFYEHHHTYRIARPAPWPCDPGVCAVGGAALTHSLIFNKTVGGAPTEDTYTDDECRDPDVIFRIPGTPGDPTTDTLVDGSFVGGMLDTRALTFSFSAAVNVDSTNIPQVLDVKCNLTTAANGKIKQAAFTSAFTTAQTEDPPRNLVSFTIFGADFGYDQQNEVYFLGGNGADAPDISLFQQFIDRDPGFDLNNLSDVEDFADAQGWVLAASSQYAYMTCDVRDIFSGRCNTIAKAVPVPALAAATLGLGLAGITYLTGRRRSIK